MASDHDVKAMIARSRAGLQARIVDRLGLGDDDSLGQADLLRGGPSPSELFIYRVVLDDDDPLHGEFGYLCDDSDYKVAYLTILRSIDRAQKQPVPARVVVLHWRDFHGAVGAGEAAELIYAAIEQVAAVTS